MKKFMHTSNITNQTNHYLQTLECQRYGGPTNDIASEMVYWWKIPADETYLNPFQQQQQKSIQEGGEDQEKFLIFEQDSAGWNNIR